jgi:hypothetical protein
LEKSHPKKEKRYKNINNQRKKILTTEDLNEILLHFRYTFRNEKFLAFEIGEDVKIFATKHNFKYLKNSQCWIADGTFLSALVGFNQLYVIYGFVFEKCIPLVYAIMNCKTENAYLKVFKYVVRKLMSIIRRKS